MSSYDVLFEDEDKSQAVVCADVSERLAWLQLREDSSSVCVEKRRITNRFWHHAQTKRWLAGTFHCRRTSMNTLILTHCCVAAVLSSAGTFTYSVADINLRLQAPLYVSPGDVWAAHQDPLKPVMCMDDVPKKYHTAVASLPLLSMNRVVEVLAALASKHGRLPSMTLRHQEAKQQPILHMWLSAAVLCRASF